MTKPVFDKVLVANRGEIALRIMKTLKKMGIKSVAVYSEADTNSLHVQYADEAYFIGNSPATESYLNIKNVINAVRSSGAQAVHPGYGFLAENPQFANALKREGVKLIGPSPHAIRVMGDKIEAKKIAIDAGVSTVPGYMGAIDNFTEAIEIAKNIGFPVIVKAAAGGGGRGMRVVASEAEMEAAFESARREASNHFSDSRVFIEKFIDKPRHIEIQLLADEYGNAVCLGERECSIQRRHQKVIEEAPSPFISEAIRNKMYDEVISLSHKIGYSSAGTVEFIVDSDMKFYFMEMNTRLQVEHPVTELITGIDIVEQMILIAAGHKLTFKQEDVQLKGWSLECRIQSEDPTRGFIPSSGRITEYSEPPKENNVRIDSGVAAGAEVSMFYDSMVAKLCTFDDTREGAIEKMKSALSSYIIKGVAHNMSFLEAVISNPRFIAGDMSTNFIAEEYPEGFTGANITNETLEIFVAAAVNIFMSEQKRISSINDQIISQASKLGTRWVVHIDGQLYPVMIKQVEDGYNIRYILGRIYVRSTWNLGAPVFRGIINGRKVNVKFEKIPTGYKLTYGGTSSEVYVLSPRVSELTSFMPLITKDHTEGKIMAPLTGQIVSIKVTEGQEVMAGQDLLILTAMKMENIISSPINGKIVKIHVKEAEQVNMGAVLLEIE